MAIFVGMIMMIVSWAIFTAVPVMLLWNWLMPAITNNAVTEIGFFQALGLILLSAFLFRSQVSINKNE